MGAGIAVQFRKRFDLANLRKHAKYSSLQVGSCIAVGRVLNLVTKQVYWKKPTYDTFTMAIEEMKKVAIDNEIKKIAMPQIGAGLDRLEWSKNREIIQKVFEDTDIEILVCKV